MVERVIASEAALSLIASLKARHGALMFHQSGGCCDNSAANCYLPGDLTIGPQDVHLGDVGGCPFYIGRAQYQYWQHTQLILDVIDGEGGTFSLEGGSGKAFHTRSRVFTDQERALLGLPSASSEGPSAQDATCDRSKETTGSNGRVDVVNDD